MRNSLNFEQKRSVQDILKRCIVVPTKKIYESNQTYKIFGKIYYVAFFLGFDKRKGHRSDASSNMKGLSMSVRGFIYIAELAIAVGIIYGVIRLIGSCINYNPADSINNGLIDDMIEEKIEDRLDQRYMLPNPLEVIDYYWWNYLKPIF